MITSETAPEITPVSPPRPTAPKVVKLAQTVIIDRPCGTVFAFRSALVNSPEWRRGVVSANLDELGPIGVGSHCIETRSGPDDSTQEWDLEITEYERGTLLGIVERRGEITVQERHCFDPEGAATRYTVAVEATGGSLSGAAFQKQLLENILQLKWALEGERTKAWGGRNPPRSS